MVDIKQEIDYYAIVGVPTTADANQITSAYRKASLKVHPDRNPDDPQAAEKFHALKTAFEFLLDPIKRAEFDAKQAARIAKAARFSGLDKKRKDLARDLEAREEAYQKQQTESSNKAAKARKLEEIKAAGARMRQEREAQLIEKQPIVTKSKATTASPCRPAFKTPTGDQADAMMCTLRLKWTKKKFPGVTSVESLSERIVSSGSVSSADIESIILSNKSISAPVDQSGNASKKGSAVVCFKSVALCETFYNFSQSDPLWSSCAVTRMGQN